MIDMTQRLDEAHRMLRRFAGGPYESAAMAYLTAQVEIAKRERESALRGAVERGAAQP